MDNFLIDEKEQNFEKEHEKLNLSFENDKVETNPKSSPNISLINGIENNELNNTQKYSIFNGTYDSKLKGIVPLFNNKNIRPNSNKYAEYEYNDINNNNNKESISLMESNFFNNQNRDSQMLMRNYSMNSYINKAFHSNIDNSIVTNNNNVLLIDNNKSTHADRLDPKNAIKINRIKDTYIDFLQKQNEDHNKINFSLDSNNKRLLNKCSGLIKDNISLNKTLNDKSNRLNKIVQENVNIKTQLEKIISNNNKNEQKMKYYEEQLDYYKNNNENYKKIIDELKEQNNKLNINITKIKENKDEEKKEFEEKYKTKIDNIKTDMNNEFNIAKKKYEDKIKELNEEIKNLKFLNQELTKELESKDNVIKIMYKDNQKLLTQNKLNIVKLEQNNKQIIDLNKILQSKETMINSLKTKDTESEKLFLSKSNSYSYLKLEGSDFLSENLTRLLNDNEENKMKIEYLSDRIKNMHEIEKKCDEIIEKSSSNEKVTYKIRNVGNSRERKNANQSYYESKNIKKSSLKKNGIQNSEINFIKSKLDLEKSPSKKNSENNVNINNDNNMISLNISTSSKEISNYTQNDYLIRSNSFNRSNIPNQLNITETKIKDNINKELDKKSPKNNLKTNSLKIIEIGKIKKSPEVEISNVIFKGRNLFKGSEYKKKNFDNKMEQSEKSVNIPYIKIFEEEKEDIKKIKNFTYNKNPYINFPKRKNSDQIVIVNESLNKKDIEKALSENSENQEKNNKIYYYLYGIDRNDFLHIFDISNKRWITNKKIFEINLDNNAESFRKDYQYEGTILYNMLSGVYILTGEKTDTLYYYNSYTEKIYRICKFNYGHNNGSIMFDKDNKFIYVFGGKNTHFCEYYSLEEKKIFKIPNLIKDRANGSFILSNNKIFGFFGFCYSEDTYVNSIEFLDLNKKDEWKELNDIKFLKENILLNVESVATFYYKNDKNKILIYCGIQGEDEDFITEYYLLYDVINNSMDKINKWNMKQFKSIGKNWKEYNLNDNDPKGFHFAKNSNFILLDENYDIPGYDKKEKMNILIDYKNNVHFISQNREKIDIYRGEI